MDTQDAHERELQERIRAGDEGAFDTVFRENYARLVRMAESVARDSAAAEEIAQEVLLQFWRRGRELRVEQSIAGYLLRSTRNRALNHVRHERIVARELAATSLDAREFPSADADTLGGELDRAVRHAIEGLPERCREVFEMSRDQGLRYAEIATILEISVKTVEKRMGQALAELRIRLGPWLEKDFGKKG